jgi:hypothetical protein
MKDGINLFYGKNKPRGIPSHAMAAITTSSLLR